MRGIRDRLRGLRRRRASEASGAAVDRRTLLVGAAASAGVAGVAAAGMSASGAAASTSAVPALPEVAATSAFGGGALVAASDVSVLPAGEIIDTDAQAVFQALDRRLSKVNLIDDLQVAMTLVDDFMGNTAKTGTIGQLGWALTLGATGTAAVGVIVNEPGLFLIGTGTSTSGWQGISLGNNNLRGAPTLLCEWRLRANPNDGSNAASYWFGLHNNLAAAEPTTGIYFRCTAADGASWRAVCANAGARTVVDTAVPVDSIFHRFRMTSDGSGIARFYIDGNLVATIVTNLPGPTGRHSPCATIRKTAGTAERKAAIDYFALRYEHAR
jgi:hypothetical protein